MTDQIKTADLVDTSDDDVRYCEHQWKMFGRQRSFHGEIATLKTFEDNRLLRETLSGDGKGKVLVVDGGGSLRCALVGDRMAALAQANGWRGLVIRAAIRDSEDIDRLDFCVLALGQSPKKSGKTGQGEIGVPLTFGNVEFRTGAYLYADADGVLVSDVAIHS